VTGRDEGHGGGRVWSTSLDPRQQNPRWSGWRPIGDKVFRPGSNVTASSLSEGATSLYILGQEDGLVWSNFFPHNGDWSGWFNLGPNSFPQGSTITALSTVPGGTSLYVTGRDEGHGGGRVWSKAFPDPQHPGQWADWRPIGDKVFRPGSNVTALSLSEGATSLYILGQEDSRVWNNFFPDLDTAPFWRLHWSVWSDQRLWPSNITFPQGSTITALSTVPGGTSLYVTGRDEGFDGKVWSTSFDPRV
jgi:hypothetical protein